MENNLEFIIKSAVLVHYCGPGGDVAIPKGVTEIEGNAFDGCTNLTNVTIPESVNEIEEINQFDDDMEYSENLIIRAPAGSYAEQCAAEHGIPLEPVPNQLRNGSLKQFLPVRFAGRSSRYGTTAKFPWNRGNAWNMS